MAELDRHIHVALHNHGITDIHGNGLTLVVLHQVEPGMLGPAGRHHAGIAGHGLTILEVEGEAHMGVPVGLVDEGAALMAGEVAGAAGMKVGVGNIPLVLVLLIDPLTFYCNFLLQFTQTGAGP